MFSRVRIAIRFFFVGLAVGVLLAPRSGEQTRRLLREKADQLLNDVLDAATLGTAGTAGGGSDAEADAAPEAKPARSGNGSRTRSKAASPSTTGSSTAGTA